MHYSDPRFRRTAHRSRTSCPPGAGSLLAPRWWWPDTPRIRSPALETARRLSHHRDPLPRSGVPGMVPQDRGSTTTGSRSAPAPTTAILTLTPLVGILYA